MSGTLPTFTIGGTTFVPWAEDGKRGFRVSSIGSPFIDMDTTAELMAFFVKFGSWEDSTDWVDTLGLTDSQKEELRQDLNREARARVFEMMRGGME